jgi:RHS repeat-associated protein
MIDKYPHITGKELDEFSGLNYFGARYYDPDVAMWMSVDPMRQHWSPYTYGGNNPVNRVDPDGMLDEEVLRKAYLDAGGDPRLLEKIFPSGYGINFSIDFTFLGGLNGDFSYRWLRGRFFSGGWFRDQERSGGWSSGASFSQSAFYWFPNENCPDSEMTMQDFAGTGTEAELDILVFTFGTSVSDDLTGRGHSVETKIGLNMELGHPLAPPIEGSVGRELTDRIDE